MSYSFCRYPRLLKLTCFRKLGGKSIHYPLLPTHQPNNSLNLNHESVNYARLMIANRYYNKVKESNDAQI